MDTATFPVVDRQCFRWILLLTTCAVYLGCLRQNVVYCAPSDDADKSSRTQISVAVINSTSVTVRWSQPPRSCPTQRYMIRLKQAGVRQSKAWRLEGERQSVSLHDLQSGTEYQLRLTTINCDGQRKHSRWVKVATAAEPVPTPNNVRQQEETQVPGQPTSVATRTSSDSAIVSWLPPDDNTLVRSYMIGYGEGVPDVKWIYVNGTERSVAILNLKPSTQYVVSVRAINKLGKGLVVYDLVFTREAPAARGDLPAPTQLCTKVLTSHSVRLQWVDPSLDSAQHITDERYYNVYYHAVQTGKNLSVIVKALHVTLHDLLPDKLYRFKVRTVKGDQTSPFSDTVANRTLPVDSVSTDDIISLLNRTGSVVNDYDYDQRDEMDDSGHIDVLQGKTKRAHGSRTRPPIAPQPPAHARTMDDPPTSRNGSTSSVAAAQTASLVHIPFRSLVQYRVSAYVTWPDRLPGSGCNAADTAQLSPGAVAGYIFRYKVLDSTVNVVEQDASAGSSSSLPTEFVVCNLATNFVLLDNLLPGVRYRYQVRYVPEKGDASAWSQEAEIDTTHTAHQLQQQQRGRG